MPSVQSHIFLRILQRFRHALPEGHALPEPVWRRRHRGLLVLLLTHAVSLTLLSVTKGYTALFSLGVGAWLTFFALMGAIPRWPRRVRASWVSLGLMTSSALLVHLSGGYIEMHFHYFVMVTILVLYQDWPPFLLAVGYVVLQHGLGGFFFPHTVYNHPDAWAHPWKWAFIHAAFLSCACIGVIIAWRANESSLAGIRASEERFRSVAQSASDAIISADSDGRIMTWNKGAEAIFLYAEDEVVGRPLTLLMPERYRAGHLKGIERMRAGGETHVIGKTVELHGLRKDGREFPLELSLSTWKTGKEQFFGGILRDATERKKAEEGGRAKEAAEKANQAKSEFLSRMSHELRTPLNSILGFGQLLEVDQLTPGQRESVEHILKGGRHLLDLINEVLDITGIEAGRLRLSIEPVRVGDVLREAVDLVRPMMSARKIRLERAAAVLADQHVRADRQRLRQVFLNLLTNAVKYNREGGVVRLACEIVGPGRLRVKVSDTGFGIPSDKLARLFTPFDRLGAEQFGVEGVGLGLVLSKRLVEAMGGVMGVDSEVDRGSTSWVELAVAKSQLDGCEVAQGQETKTVAAAGSGQTHMVLYIEDNLSNLTLIERLVAQRPHLNLISAMQGQIGLDLARQHHPDLILLDLHLPDMAGEEVLRRIQGDPSTAQIPVVMLTADATGSQMQNLLAAGARAYLTKPLDVKHFFELLDEILKEKDSRP